MTMSDLKAAKRFLRDMGGGAAPTPVLAAVSGGLDSMCLLHLLSTWGREQDFRVTAAHFNHRLRGEAADRDEAFVREVCARWNIPCVCGSGDTRALAEREGLSIEEAARQLRYAFLAERQEALGCTWVLTAHHADDNAETMLLNLLRGTGARGLTGIPEFRGCIARPLLAVTREELAAYAKEHNIPHVEDETNLELDAARNVLRHKVLPVLRELNPRAAENMARTAELLSRDDDALTAQAEQLLREHARVEGDRRAELPVLPCMEREQAVVSRALLLVLANISGHRRDLSQTHVEALLGLLRTGRPGQSLSLPYGMTALRAEDSLFLFREAAPLPEETPILPGQSVAFGGWQVSLSETLLPEGEYDKVSLPANGVLSVSSWQSRDRMTLPGSRGSRTVKRLAADRGMTPAERDRLPVLRVDGRPAAIPGIGIDMEFTPKGQAPLWVIFKKHTEENTHEK